MDFGQIFVNTFKRMMKALDPERAATGSDDEHMVLPNVLCPWGCCEFHKIHRGILTVLLATRARTTDHSLVVVRRGGYDEQVLAAAIIKPVRENFIVA